MIDAPQGSAGGSLTVTRSREGRMIAGVCAGLPPIAGLGTGAKRVAFCVTALCGGIGIVLYAACWLVLPASPQVEDEDAGGVRGAVQFAWVAGGLVVALLLAAAGALAAALGLGWVVFGLACVILAAGASGRTRLPSQAGLLAVVALALPATAVALSSVRIELQTGASVSRPATAAGVRAAVFRSGLGTRLIDLRHTRLPRSGDVSMQIDGGLRRTIVALPSDRCVHVEVRYQVHTFVAQFAALLSGRLDPPFHDVVLFNRIYGGSMANDPHGVAVSDGARRGPTLVIHFSSFGGGLFVRNYPGDVDPQIVPEWPGFPVEIERRPYVADEPHTAAREMIRAWRGRVAKDRLERRRYEDSLPGPCARS